MTPARVGLVGGGRMGAGIAHAFLCAGAAVAVVERDDETADAAANRIRGLLEQSVRRRTLGRDPGEVLRSLAITTDAQVLVDCSLVIEAVPEVRALKADAFARAEAVIGDDAVLASNTSSISIDALATDVARPARFLGMHFFNPVPSSRLVELVAGTATDPGVIARVRGWVEDLGKSAVVVRDAPGFASSRLGVALGLEAIRMVEDGVAAPVDIDTAMELGYGHPMGPLRTTDIVGLDVRLGIAEELHAQLGERFAPPALLRRMVAEGRLGRKSGRGFYEWSER
jgi:3-hydroxybutyryl-CoA dehydrogenase